MIPDQTQLSRSSLIPTGSADNARANGRRKLRFFTGPRVHWMRNAQSYVPKAQQSMAAAAMRQAFIQPDRATASQALRHVADQLRDRCPKQGSFIVDSETDVLLSVLILACAIAFTCTGLATMTRATRCDSILTTDIALPVASTTISLSFRKRRPKPSRLDRVTSTRSCCRSLPFSQTTTSANVRWCPYQSPASSASPFLVRKRELRATRHLRIRALGATGQVAGAASYKHELSAHRIDRPARTCVLPVPLSRMVSPYAAVGKTAAGSEGTATVIRIRWSA